MPSERKLFQQVVKKSISLKQRREMVREIGRLNGVEQLETLTRTNGIDGALRRDAVSELKSLRATDALEAIAADGTVDDAIRKRAQL
ncbi:hypothetical protein [Halocatena marina]|uniref:Uncharacterized protein n=1 Tax=Halocatena marina TaxID=2934937 RepID=A0ABD5YTL4_9EURY|nr:hypothetical protein [Halocatena marina]